MDQQAEHQQMSFGESLKKDRRSSKSQKILWNLETPDQLNSNCMQLTVPYRNSLTSSTMIDQIVPKEITSQIIGYEEFENLSGSNEVMGECRKQIYSEIKQRPKSFQELQKLKESLAEQRDLMNANIKLSQYVKKLTAQKKQFEHTIHELSSQLKRANTPEKMHNKIEELTEIVTQLRKENYELKQSNEQYRSSQQWQEVEGMGLVQQKYKRKAQKYQNLISELRIELQNKVSEAFEVFEENHIIVEQLKEKQAQLEHYHEVQEKLKQFQSENQVLRDNLSGQEKDAKILSYCLEIDRLNNVLKQEIQANNKVQIQYEKLKEMVKLRNSLETVQISPPLDQPKSIAEQKAELFLQIKSSLNKSSQISLEESSQASQVDTIKKYNQSINVDHLEEEVYRLQGLLGEEQSQSLKQTQRIEELESTIQRYEVITVKLQQRVISLQNKLQQAMNNSQGSNKARKQFNKLETNYKYSEQYIQYLEDELSRLKSSNKEAIGWINQLNRAYEGSIDTNAQLQNKNKSLQKLIDKLAHKSQINTKLYEQNLGFLEDELKRLTDEKKTNVNRAQAKIQELIDIIKCRSQELQTAADKQQLAQKALSNLSKQLQELQQKNCMVSREKKELETKICVLEREQEYLEKEIRNIKEQEEDQIIELEDLLDKLQIYEQQLDFLCFQNGSLKEKLSIEQVQNKNLAQQIEQFQDKSRLIISQLQEKHQQEITQIERLFDQQKMKSEQFQEAAEDASIILSDNITEIQAQIIKLRSQYVAIDTLKSQNKQYLKIIEDLKQENLELKEISHQKDLSIQAIETERTELKQKIDSLESLTRKEDLIKNDQDIIVKNKELENSCRELKKREKQLEGTIKQISLQFDKLKSYICKLKPKNINLKTVVGPKKRNS